MKKRSIAIITARGGSKRIPKKNIREFCGIPIIAYSIKTALECNVFDEVMVSTDSEEIALVAREYNAKVPFFRSDKNSDDYSTTEDVILEVLDEYKKIGKEFDYVCCLYPTAPFVNKDIILESMQKMENYNPAVIIPVVKFSYPPQRSFVIDARGYAKFKYPEYVTTRSQDLESWYHDVGQFYVYNVEKLIELNGIITDDFMPVIVSDMQVQDIDTEEDWKIAEVKYKVLHSND